MSGVSGCSSLKLMLSPLIRCRVGAGIAPDAPHGPGREYSLIRFVSDGPCGPKTLQLTRPQGDMTVAAHQNAYTRVLILLQSAPALLRQLSGLEVPAAFPWHRRHARHCLPAALRLLSWVPWALVPHAFGLRLPPAPRYCALLRLPSSVPVGALCAPFRHLGFTRSVSCPPRLSPA